MRNVKKIATQILSDNLLELMRLANNISPTQLSKETGIPQATIHRILKDPDANPTISTINQLTTFFNVPFDALLGNGEFFHSQHFVISKVPVIPWGSIQTFKAHSIDETMKLYVLVETETDRHDLFALTSTQSLSPRFPVGTTLIIDPVKIPEDGNLVLVTYKTFGNSVVRELILNGPKAQLLSLQDEEKIEIMDKNTEIRGVIIKAIFNYEN